MAALAIPVTEGWHTIQYLASVWGKNPRTLQYWCENGFMVECGFKVQQDSSRQWWVYAPDEAEVKPVIPNPLSDKEIDKRVAASQAVCYAVRSGKLDRPDKCAKCGRACKPEGHHRDYDKPLEVSWLCRDCHMSEHPKAKSIVVSMPIASTNLISTNS